MTHILRQEKTGACQAHGAADVGTAQCESEALLAYAN